LTSAPYGGLLLPARLLRETGLPDPQFVLYADDTEFTDRIVRRGGRIRLVAAAHVADISSSWQSGGRLRDAWLDETSEARVFYGARNEAWFDFHRLMANRWLYRFHRGIVLAAWWCASRREPRRTRYTLLVEAIRAGEAGRLGVDARFPLETAPDAE
ncbi:MAG: glycosyl transferase family 2, partial [Casimicrobiaceae bacterium]